jgi:beta-N-acetylglucosaminidase
MSFKSKKILYRIISAMMGLIIVIMAFSLNTIKVNAETDYNAFPSGYRAKLREINRLHPNWTFVPFNTGLDWNTVVDNEMQGNRSLVYVTCDDSWKSKDPGDYDASTGTYIGKSGKNWLRASRVAVEYCLNPVNYLDEYHVFAFEQLSYNPSIHNVDGVEAIIANSWMSHRPLEDQPNMPFNYSNFFIQAAMDSGVSPYHLASRVLQEQGRGDIAHKANYNPLISGEYGVYNYYNIGAYGKNSAEIIANGRAYAENKGWYTRALALSGGAQIIGADWINRGQDTLYLEKFDVDSSDGGLYYHQYMQNLQAPMAESGSVYRAYEECGAINSNFVFKIPVYNNMPNEEPEVDHEKIRQFVTRLYNVCLDRDPDEKGLEHWTNILAEGRQTGSQVGYGFAFSQEFKNHNYCNSCYVKQLYKAFLGREYDDSGLEHWVSKLNEGKTREEILNGFLLSVEFGGICEEYGIDRGTGIEIPQYGTVARGTCAGCGESDNVTQFITRLYSVCFNRLPDEEGLNHNCTLLWDHTITATQMAHGFIFSQEFINLGLDDSAFVDSLYRSMMDREADEEGKNYWMDKLANGTSREEVFMGFAKSTEFNNLCKRYGVSN